MSEKKPNTGKDTVRDIPDRERAPDTQAPAERQRDAEASGQLDSLRRDVTIGQTNTALDAARQTIEASSRGVREQSQANTSVNTPRPLAPNAPKNPTAPAPQPGTRPAQQPAPTAQPETPRPPAPRRENPKYAGRWGFVHFLFDKFIYNLGTLGRKLNPLWEKITGGLDTFGGWFSRQSPITQGLLISGPFAALGARFGLPNIGSLFSRSPATTTPPAAPQGQPTQTQTPPPAANASQPIRR